jgi:hypothetical protein
MPNFLGRTAAEPRSGVYSSFRTQAVPQPMSETAEWDRWLADADSVKALAPDGYDDHAAVILVKALRQPLTNALANYEVRAASTELYQDSTGMADYRVTAKGDSK